MKQKINKEQFLELYKQNLSDRTIAKILNVGKTSVCNYRNTLGLPIYNRYKEITLSSFSKEVLIGTLLGDGYLSINKSKTSARGHIAHSTKQREYFMYKYNILKDIISDTSENSLYHKKTSKTYYELRMSFISSPILLEIYNKLYTPKKVITKEYLELFSRISLAFMYMDDGYKTKSSYMLSTNGFNTNSLIVFKDYLKDKFDLEFSILKRNIIYLKKKDVFKFESLIKEFFIKEMFYKLHRPE